MVPSECQQEVIDNRFESALSDLSPNFLDLTPRQQAKELLELKARDYELYSQLRATALRCGAWAEDLKENRE